MAALQTHINAIFQFSGQYPGNHRGTGTTAAGQGFSRSAFINAQSDMAGIKHLHKTDINALREQA